MQYILSDEAMRDYRDASVSIQRAFEKQVDFLLGDIRHPSLRAKKYDEALGIWQARINRSFRFYFLIHEDTYYIFSITKHPK